MKQNIHCIKNFPCQSTKYCPKISGLKESLIFTPQLKVIKEISNLSNESHLPSPEIPSDPMNEPYHVDRDTIAKLEQDLNKVKLTLRRDPGTKNRVSYDHIKKFSEVSEDE